MTNVHPDPLIDDDNEHTGEGASRRAWLKNVAIGAAGATAGAMAFGKSASAGDSGGTQIDGNATELGETNTSDAPTIIDYEGAAITEGPSVFSAGEEVPAADAPFPAAVGGYGGADVANGVHGSTTNAAGHGVVAASLADAAATATDPAPAPALGLVSLNGSHIHFVAGTVAGPTQGVHVPGELYVDVDGTLWFSVATATAGEVAWVKLAAAGQQASAGAFFAINPARSYDSRKTSYAVNGPLAPNLNREISVADDHHRDSGAVTASNVVPLGATAALVNVTVSSPTDKNYIAVTAGDVATTATSLQNWDAGVTQIANSVTVPLSPTRTIRVYMGDQAGSADIVVDVFGYYL